MTYGEIVRTQFAKHRDAVWCLRLLVAVILVAVYAPVVALDVPFWTNLGGEWSFPWFRALYDPSVFNHAVDLFFNVLMVFLPFFLLVWWKTSGRTRRGLLLLLTAGLVAGFLHLHKTSDQRRTA